MRSFDSFVPSLVAGSVVGLQGRRLINHATPCALRVCVGLPYTLIDLLSKLQPVACRRRCVLKPERAPSVDLQCPAILQAPQVHTLAGCCCCCQRAYNNSVAHLRLALAFTVGCGTEFHQVADQVYTAAIPSPCCCSSSSNSRGKASCSVTRSGIGRGQGVGIAEPNRAVARRSPAAVGVPVNQRCEVVVCLSMLLLGRCDRLGCTLSGVGVVLLVVRMAVLAHDRQVHGQKTSCDSPDAKSVGGGASLGR